MNIAGELSSFEAGWHHFQRKELDSAIACFTGSIACNEHVNKSYYLRGNVQLELKNFEAAISDYSAALAHNQLLVEALLNRGTAYQEIGQMSAAMSDFTQAISMQPKLFNGYYCRARLLKALNAPSEALADFQIALELSPGSIIIRNNIGSVHLELNDFTTALQIFDEILVDAPDYVPALSNRGAALKAQSQHQDAQRDFEKAVKIAPDLAVAYYNLGDLQREIGDYKTAIKSFLSARLKGHPPQSTNWNMGLCHLALGEYATGWDFFEDRLEVSEFTKTAFLGHASLPNTHIRNTCEDVIARKVFLAGEQGIGDCIMFMSMLPDLLRDAGKVICQLDHRLIGLFSRCFPGVDFVTTEDINTREAITGDRYMRIGSLGYIYRRDVGTFSGAPYLTPDPVRVAQWQSRIPTEPGKLKVGLSWRGGSRKTNGQTRSIDLQQLIPLLDRGDRTFVSLQHGDVADEIAEFNKTRTHKLIGFPGDNMNDFEDFAGLIGALDCVVSIDNTTLHLSGALGKPCFTPLSSRAEWRFGVEGESMPWYRSVKLFRQLHYGKWTDVIDKINDALNIMSWTHADACSVLPVPSTSNQDIFLIKSSMAV